MTSKYILFTANGGSEYFALLRADSTTVGFRSGRRRGGSRGGPTATARVP
jgi:hypothetical protein